MRLGLHPHSSGPVSNSVYNNIFHYTDVEHACVLFSLFLFKYKSIFQKFFFNSKVLCFNNYAVQLFTASACRFTA